MIHSAFIDMDAKAINYTNIINYMKELYCKNEDEGLFDAIDETAKQLEADREFCD